MPYTGVELSQVARQRLEWLGRTNKYSNRTVIEDALMLLEVAAGGGTNEELLDLNMVAAVMRSRYGERK